MQNVHLYHRHIPTSEVLFELMFTNKRLWPVTSVCCSGTTGCSATWLVSVRATGTVNRGCCLLSVSWSHGGLRLERCTRVGRFGCCKMAIKEVSVQ